MPRERNVYIVNKLNGTREANYISDEHFDVGTQVTENRRTYIVDIVQVNLTDRSLTLYVRDITDQR